MVGLYGSVTAGLKGSRPETLQHCRECSLTLLLKVNFFCIQTPTAPPPQPPPTLKCLPENWSSLFSHLLLTLTAPLISSPQHRLMVSSHHRHAQPLVASHANETDADGGGRRGMKGGGRLVTRQNSLSAGLRQRENGRSFTLSVIRAAGPLQVISCVDC